MTVTDQRPTVEVDADDWQQTQADLAALREQNRLLRDAANKAHRTGAENGRLDRIIHAMVAERDTAVASAKELGNELATVRQQLDGQRATANVALADLLKAREQIADLEAALIEANKGRPLSNAEHLHQRLAAAALVIGRWQDWWFCPLCQHLGPFPGPHGCGPLIPVDVIIARRKEVKP